MTKLVILSLFVFSSFLRSYCVVGTLSLRIYRPMIFDSCIGLLLVNIAWIIPFLIGTGLLFVQNRIWSLIAVISYLCVFPSLITPLVKKYMLPPWDRVKAILEQYGYTKDDYLYGDWWKESR